MGDANATYRLNLTLDAEDTAVLQEACRLAKLTRSDVVRRALRYYLHRLKEIERERCETWDGVVP